MSFMFIIFGTRGVTSTPDRGSFHCPQCGLQCSYALKSVRRFFTLYFIPLIPLDKLSEYVECDSCKGTFNSGVLSFDPAAEREAFLAEFQVAVRDILVQMMLADGEISDDEVEAIRMVCADIGGLRLSPDDIHALVDQARTNTESVIGTVRRHTPMLNASGKETVIRAATIVALADGDFDKSEQNFLGEVGRALEMSNAHIRGVVSDVIQLPRNGADA
ncbi:MAG: hypothetical protein CMM48_15610 [Rhodospirillaceae bacterium]|nr:hypothetical protein [Rhodospirillaceae bacterium]|tara:strand:+ start:2049 stop:2702 length:654 start_codon:yes stop_codon:yes gene_type:complete